MHFLTAISRSSWRRAQRRHLVLPMLIASISLLVACGGGNDPGSPTSVEPNSAGTAADLMAMSGKLNSLELEEALVEASVETAPSPLMLAKTTSRAPVYRFFNGQTGAHFYTISPVERDRVRNTLPMFSYEGEAFFVSPVTDAGLSPVHRFFNRQTGVHFYSISADEKAFIEANLPQFSYEGVAYYASKTRLPGFVPLYRFYVTTKGFHFYTASASEKDHIRATLPHYAFENVGYYAMETANESFMVGGALAGLVQGQSLVLQNNAGDDLTLSANGAFTFAAAVIQGGTYSVSVKTQPAGQTCVVSNATGTASAEVNNVSVSCANNALTDLVISEVGGCPFANSGCWLEVYNPTATARNLVNYRLRTGSTIANLFSLPNAVIAPGGFRILAGNVDADAPVSVLNTVAMVGGAGGVPDWSSTGLVELLSVASGATVDAVRFGASTAPQASSDGQWSGPAVMTTFMGAGSDAARSVVRPWATMGSQDTNSAQDWVAVDFATPGGPNDVAPGAVDADDDGLPDANELLGSMFNGLDLYAMGARTSQRDIFVEVDHMNSIKPGVIPLQASMQKVKDAFASRGFYLHIDVGTLFSTGFDPSQFNLGQGDGTVPYQACVGFDVENCSANTSADYRTVYDWKWQHFDPRRRGVFHYALFGDGEAGGVHVGGRGELFGNDFVVTMGGFSGAPDHLINLQASTFMHELGHNLGLHHGGNDEVNFKPNYLSVMNYLMDSVPPGNTIWPYKKWKQRFGGGSEACYPGSTNPLCAAPVPFAVDYSDGSSQPLNESALNESENVGRGALPGVYADWDENFVLTASPVSRDLNGDGLLGVLTDHNDWAAVTLPFARYYGGQLLQKSVQTSVARKAAKVPEQGATVANPLMDDRGPTVITCGTPDSWSPYGKRSLSRKALPERTTPLQGGR